jgi:excisionase family DNA binding protein
MSFKVSASPNPCAGDGLNGDDVLLTRKEAASYLRVSVPTLERWAREGREPRPIHIGRRALYRLSRLRAATGLKVI